MKAGLALADQGGDRDQRSARAHSPTGTSRPHRSPMTPTRQRLVVITRHTSADFARQATIAEFGWNHGKALDQADFRDRPPGQFPTPAPKASPL